VLHLPRTDERCEARDRSILWQRTHGRAISASTTGDAAWRLSYLARLSEQQLAKPRPRPSADSPITSRVFHCAQADLRTLNDLGFSAVLLDKSVSAHLALLQTLQMVLGEPLLDRPELSLWSLPTEKNDRPPAACTLPTSAD
jgi:hypothetical protein